MNYYSLQKHHSTSDSTYERMDSKINMMSNNETSVAEHELFDSDQLVIDAINAVENALELYDHSITMLATKAANTYG